MIVERIKHLLCFIEFLSRKYRRRDHIRPKAKISMRLELVSENLC